MMRLVPVEPVEENIRYDVDYLVRVGNGVFVSLASKTDGTVYFDDVAGSLVHWLDQVDELAEIHWE